jgi:hypothetical protein
MYAMPLTILAVIFGVIGMKKETGKGMAIGGLICGVVGTLVAAFWIYTYMSVKAEIEDPNSDFNQGMEQVEKDFNEAAKELENDLNRETPDPVTPDPETSDAAE